MRMNGKIGSHLKQDAHNDYPDISFKKMEYHRGRNYRCQVIYAPHSVR